MTPEAIEKFVENKQRADSVVNIHFRERSTVTGLFIRFGDYEELKSKNFWRIVSTHALDAWKETGDVNLGRIYHGVSFSRLTDEKVV
jgi:hypothetical protein